MYIHLNVCKQLIGVKVLLLHSYVWNHLIVSKKKKKDQLRLV